MTNESNKLNWDELDFSYTEVPFRWRAYWKDGEWYKAGLETDPMLPIHEASPIVNYGQGVFEGHKAYGTKDGNIVLFRPDEFAERLNRGARRLGMPEVPVEDFIHACKETVKANRDFVPPFGHDSAALFIRPMLLGVGDHIQVSAAEEYLFTIYVTPVGPLYKGGLQPSDFVVDHENDRVAAGGNGDVKATANYAATLATKAELAKQGYADVVYLDPATHTKIDELSSANFFGIEKGTNKFVTPLSDTVLPSITKKSLLWVAENRLGLEVEEGDVYADDLDRFAEAGAMGNAAVISPMGSLTYKGEKHVFHSETEVGPVSQKLYDELVKIQFGEVEAPEGWLVDIDE
ncbi:branched-chain amino acid aminotransferase [Aerococcaceae bacterium DSM 111022]|nr:branched-chain amino acid aminotransferase [Aerococcaceae bacterium DSM 111022]MBG9988007.1 branched-chain amino acid aminotransferase [Aerococcaceae bacterium DSM 111176]